MYMLYSIYQDEDEVDEDAEEVGCTGPRRQRAECLPQVVPTGVSEQGKAGKSAQNFDNQRRTRRVNWIQLASDHAV